MAMRFVVGQPQALAPQQLRDPADHHLAVCRDDGHDPASLVFEDDGLRELVRRYPRGAGGLGAASAVVVRGHLVAGAALVEIARQS